MKIRTYNEKDKKAVISLWNECGLVAPQNNPDRDIEQKLKVDSDLFLVGVSENKIIPDSLRIWAFLFLHNYG
jgi:hypothetical protein